MNPVLLVIRPPEGGRYNRSRFSPKIMKIPGPKACRFLVLAVVALSCIAIAAARQSPQQTPMAGPFTAAQADAGQVIYQSTCAPCHLPNMRGNFEAPPLAGGNFLNTWGNRTTVDLFSRIRATMPANNPGSLSDDDTADLVAYILRSNGSVASAQAMTARTMIPIGAVTTENAPAVQAGSQTPAAAAPAPVRASGPPVGVTITCREVKH